MLCAQLRVLQTRTTESKGLSSNFPYLRRQGQEHWALGQSMLLLALRTDLLSFELRVILSLEREVQEGMMERRLAMGADQLLVLGTRILATVFSQQASRADEPVSTEVLHLPPGHPDEL